MARSLFAAFSLTLCLALTAGASHPPAKKAAAKGKRPAPAAAGPVSARLRFSQDTPGKPAAPPRWTRAMPELADSRIRAFALADCGIDNAAALQNLVAHLPHRPASEEYSLLVVPGSSERMGHHQAWIRSSVDQHWVEPEFRARLRQAFNLLYAGVVHTLIISGASIDTGKPEYNEAIYGFRELVDEYGAAWRSSPAAHGDRLEHRVVVDPWAVHSQTNIRNADRIALYAGLDRLLIVSTAGTFKQGWWFSHHRSPAMRVHLGSMDSISDTSMGYHLGAFGELPDGGHDVFGDGTSGGHAGAPVRDYRGRSGHPALPLSSVVRTGVVAHWNLNRAGILGDRLWDVGRNDNDAVRAPDTDLIGRNCHMLRGHRR